MTRPYIIILFILSWLTSCSHKDILCYGNDPVPMTVRFMWDNAPSANPDGMTLYFFPISDGTRIWRFDISGRDGGSVELPLGAYRFLAFNNDLSGIDFSGQDEYSHLTATARKSLVADLIRPTGMLYGGSADYLEVTPCGIIYTARDGIVKECRQGLLRCYTDSLNCVYNVVLSGCKGLENMRSATCYLNGIASSLLVTSDHPEGEPATTAFILERMDGSEATVLKGSTTVFGFVDSPSPCVTLTLAVVRTDGTSVKKSFDVTEQVINSSNPHNVYIKLNGIEIPDGDIPDNPGGDVGIEVGVDGWQVIEIDIGSNLP